MTMSLVNMCSVGGREIQRGGGEV